MDEHNDLASSGQARTFGNYDLIRRIDMGGMGEVYLARQRTAFQREVAVKIIRDTLAHDPLARARFFREAEVSSRLKHDHILPLFEFGEIEGRLFLVTPYISGGTLEQRLQAGPLSLLEVQQFFIALVKAVAYIHRRGVVHRDLKPNNILLDDEEEPGQLYVRLIDFGIATRQGAAASPPLTPSGHEVGTAAYMAPERLDGVAAPSNDIYSLGVILYQLLTRHLPIKGKIYTDALPAPFVNIIECCIATRPEERYTTAIELLHAFEQSCQAIHQDTAQTDQAAPISNPFDAGDYAAPTMTVTRTWRGQEAQHALLARTAAMPMRNGTKIAHKHRPRRKPLVIAVSLLTAVVLLTMIGLAFFTFPLSASANVTLGSQVHTLQQIYTLTARPSLTSIDAASASLPALEKVETLTSSLAGPTSGQLCRRFPCSQQQVVSPTDVETLSSQLRQSLIAQLSTDMDSHLQTVHGILMGSKHFTDLSTESVPAIGMVSQMVTVTLTEQVSVAYVNAADIEQLTRTLMTQQLDPNIGLVNSTVQIGQPVVEEITDLGIVTLKVAAAGIEEYQQSPAQLQAIVNHIKGMALTDARLYLQQQPGIDAQSISISIHTTFGAGDTLPASTSQIKIIAVTPATLPSTSLPAIATPIATPTIATPTL